MLASQMGKIGREERGGKSGEKKEKKKLYYSIKRGEKGRACRPGGR